MIRLALRFPAGRYHATPWAHHVNEGLTEWPPSPWRLVRAMVSLWHTRSEGLNREAARRAILKLVEPPSYGLPSVTQSHTRHYLSQNRLEVTDTSLTFDTFAVLDPNEDLIVEWPIELCGEEDAAFWGLASRLTYLGRGESWCEARRDASSRETNCRPADGVARRGFETVRALCPAEGFTFADVERTTAEIQREGWSDPPGTRWVLYRRPIQAPSVRRASSTPEGAHTEVVELALGAKVLPLVTDTVLLADRLRRAVMSRYGKLSRSDGIDTKSETLSGRSAAGPRLRNQHSHAHYFADCRDPSRPGRVTHLLVWAPGGLSSREVAAIRSVSYLPWPPTDEDRRGGSDGPTRSWPRADRDDEGLDVIPAIVGSCPLLAREGRALFRPSRGFVSRTPFVLPRFPKNGRESVTDQVSRELAFRGLPEPLEVGSHPPERHPWGSFVLARPSRRRPMTGLHGLALRFREPVHGPLLLGQGSHYGLGLFEPREP